MSSMSQPCPSSLSVRDDLWSEDATFTLIEAWEKYRLDLNRGNLRLKLWREVADAVNSRHGHELKSLRTGIQCKNRIDTLKKKYKVEKAKVFKSSGSYTCTWPYFSCLDDLFGNSYEPSTPVSLSYCETSPVTTQKWSLFSHVPVGPRSGTKKRSSTHLLMNGDSYLRRDAGSKEDEVRDDLGSGSHSSKPRFMDREVGYKKLARAIETLSNVYERVEVAKQRQLVELEMQRMQFAKDLEYHRMLSLREMQLQIQKIKRARGASKADCY